MVKLSTFEAKIVTKKFTFEGSFRATTSCRPLLVLSHLWRLRLLDPRQGRYSLFASPCEEKKIYRG